MLDAVVDFLPSPLDLPPVKGVTMDGKKNYKENVLMRSHFLL